MATRFLCLNDEPQEQEEIEENQFGMENSDVELFNLKGYDKIVPPLEIEVSVNEINIYIEIDTGSGMSLISDSDYYKCIKMQLS